MAHNIDYIFTKNITTTLNGNDTKEETFLVDSNGINNSVHYMFNHIISSGLKRIKDNLDNNIVSEYIDNDNCYGCVVYYNKSSINTMIVSSTFRDRNIFSKKMLEKIEDDEVEDENIEEDFSITRYNIDNKDPNSRYEDKKIDTWNTKEDVDKFFEKYKYSNWEGLNIGNYVTINDGVYNKDWVIAGFDIEKAADNGYGGIIFIPRYMNLTNYHWDSNSTSPTPYKDSDIHEYINSTVYNNLYTILGDHIRERKVTLGSECNGTDPREWTTSKTTNTTAYLTLMSVYQKMGFNAYYNSKDEGEADYKLPLFNFIDNNTYAGGTIFWLRNVYGMYSSGGIFRACSAFSDESVSHYHVNLTCGVRPLMYLR